MNRRLFYDHLSACAVRVTSNNKLPPLRLSDALPLEGEVGWDMRSANLVHLAAGAVAVAYDDDALLRLGNALALQVVIAYDCG